MFYLGQDPQNVTLAGRQKGPARRGRGAAMTEWRRRAGCPPQHGRLQPGNVLLRPGPGLQRPPRPVPGSALGGEQAGTAGARAAPPAAARPVRAWCCEGDKAKSTTVSAWRLLQPRPPCSLRAEQRAHVPAVVPVTVIVFSECSEPLNLRGVSGGLRASGVAEPRGCAGALRRVWSVLGLLNLPIRAPEFTFFPWVLMSVRIQSLYTFTFTCLWHKAKPKLSNKPLKFIPERGAPSADSCTPVAMHCHFQKWLLQQIRFPHYLKLYIDFCSRFKPIVWPAITWTSFAKGGLFWCIFRTYLF